MKQWISLFTLTCGCIVHVGGIGDGDDDDNKEDVVKDSGHLVIGSFLVLSQILCSVFAGVYTEFIIKSKEADVHIMMQNVFMYLDSILCNILLLSLKVSRSFVALLLPVKHK